MIVCLHGFLGLPTDWDFLRVAGFEIREIDLWREPSPLKIEAQPGDVLLGYSMGGRLALEILTETPGRWRAAVIISAGLNLEDRDDRAARRARDEEWARRFETEEWTSLIEAWNAQPIFEGQRSLARREIDFDRDALARALRQWSPGLLEPLSHRLSKLDIPVLWIAGEHDEKYVEVGNHATELLTVAQLWICPGSGHRVPWDRPELFIEKLRSFVSDPEAVCAASPE